LDDASAAAGPPRSSKKRVLSSQAMLHPFIQARNSAMSPEAITL